MEMNNISMTKEEIVMLKDAIQSHIVFLFKYADDYKNNGNIDAI